MPGVILFTLVLLFFSLLLMAEAIGKAIPAFAGAMEALRKWSETGSVRVILSLCAVFLGIWNFFSPDFGVSTTVVGALLPALLLMFDGAVLYPNIVEIFNIPQETKDKYYQFVEKFKAYAGVMTLVAAVLHLVLHLWVPTMVIF